MLSALVTPSALANALSSAKYDLFCKILQNIYFSFSAKVQQRHLPIHLSTKCKINYILLAGFYFILKIKKGYALR